MEKYIFAPSNATHPTQNELQLLLGRLDHDFMSSFSLPRLLIHDAIDDIRPLDKPTLQKIGLLMDSYGTIARALINLSHKEAFVDRCEASKLVEQLADYAIYKSRKTSITIERRLPQPGFTVQNYGSVCYLQAFNFLQNALQSNKDGGPNTVTIGIEQYVIAAEDLPHLGERNKESYEEGSHFAHFYVADQGVGISQDDISKIFQQGYSTNGPNRGSGFGFN